MSEDVAAAHARMLLAEEQTVRALIDQAFGSYDALPQPRVGGRTSPHRVTIDEGVRDGIQVRSDGLHVSPRTAAALAGHVRASAADPAAAPSPQAVSAADEVYRAVMTVNQAGRDNPYAQALRTRPELRQPFLEGTALASTARVEPSVTHRRQVAAAETAAAALASRSGLISDPTQALTHLATLGDGAAEHAGYHFIGDSGNPLADRMAELRKTGKPGDRRRHDAYVARVSAPLGTLFTPTGNSRPYRTVGDPVDMGRLDGLMTASRIRQEMIAISAEEGLIAPRQAERDRARVEIRSAAKATRHLYGMARFKAAKWLSTASFKYLGVAGRQAAAWSGDRVAGATRWTGHQLGVRRDPEKGRTVTEDFFAR